MPVDDNGPRAPAKTKNRLDTPAAGAKTVRPARAPKRRRAEKSAAKREALFRAASEIVGEVGYRDASIAQITARAGVAQGTFYTYFDTRQELFDQLLPTLGQEMLDFIRDKVADTKTLREREREGFAAFFAFLVEKPSFYRILNEAEHLAPRGHKAHFHLIVEGYRHALEQAWEAGECPGYDKRELEAIIYILLAARSYLALRFAYEEDGVAPIPDWVTKTYMKFFEFGIRGEPTPSSDGARSTAPSEPAASRDSENPSGTITSDRGA